MNKIYYKLNLINKTNNWTSMIISRQELLEDESKTNEATEGGSGQPQEPRVTVDMDSHFEGEQTLSFTVP